MTNYLLFIAILATPTSLLAETFDKPACIKKSSSDSRSVVEWITLTGAAALEGVSIVARMDSPLNRAGSPSATVMILLNEIPAVKNSLVDKSNSYYNSTEVFLAPKLKTDQEYKIRALGESADATSSHTISMTIDVANGCSQSKNRKTSKLGFRLPRQLHQLNMASSWL